MLTKMQYLDFKYLVPNPKNHEVLSLDLSAYSTE